MYDRNRQNSAGSAISAGSHPRIPPAHRLSNASEGKASTMSSPGRTLNKQQMRCNSMGNLPRSGGHHSIQRRHPSAGNVASNKDGLCVEPLTYPSKGAHHPQQQGHLYNSPYQGQGQGHGNYQGQGDYQGQKRQSPGTPGRGGPGGYTKSPMTPRPGMTGQPMGSPAKAPQRNRPVGPGGVPYQSPGPPGRTGNRPNSPYEYGTTENGIDANRRYHGNDTPQWESNPSHNSNGPTHARSNGRLHRRESYENIQPFDNLPDPLVHGEHRTRVYGKGLAKPSFTDPLISPLDSAPTPSNSSRYPAPPDHGSDSSDDDLYSLVAKGNYDSVINDPLNVRKTFRTEKPRYPVGNKHSAGRAPGRMFSDTSV